MSEAEPSRTYRFKTLGAAGTISYGTDYVYTNNITYLVAWKQTIPLADIRPRYGELRTTSNGFVKSWICSILLLMVGLYGLFWSNWPDIATSLCIASIFMGCGMVWTLIRNGTTDWIIFNTGETGFHLSYSRQGPDADQCQLFTDNL